MFHKVAFHHLVLTGHHQLREDQSQPVVVRWEVRKDQRKIIMFTGYNIRNQDPMKKKKNHLKPIYQLNKIQFIQGAFKLNIYLVIEYIKSRNSQSSKLLPVFGLP